MQVTFGWRTWAWSAGGALLAGVLFAGYLSLRGLLPAPWLGVVELLVLFAVLVIGAAFLAAWAVRRHYQENLRRLGTQVEALHEQAQTQSAQRRETPAATPSDTRPADAEEGHSHSDIHSHGGAQPGRFARRMIARLDPKLHWRSATPALLQFLGYDSAALQNRSFLEVVHSDDSLPLIRRFQEALDSGEAHHVIFRIRTRAGSIRHMDMDVLARYHADGQPLLLRCHLLDTTDRIRTEEEFRRRAQDYFLLRSHLRRVSDDLERLKESYGELYHGAPILYFSLDSQGDFTACNDTLLQTLGYQRDELLGQPYLRVLAPEGQQHYQQNPRVYQQTSEIETQWLTKEGRLLDVQIRNLPSLDAEGRFVRSRSTAQDVTERNRLVRMLQTREEELGQIRAELQRLNGERTSIS
jgi:PAS domain S-box-containing protein